MTAAGGVAVLMGRCNPFGHETGGPRRLLGGMYGPEHEGRIKWECHNDAEVRVRMMCVGPARHRGQIMKLCRPHVLQIQKRQAGLCPPCAWPPEALALDLEIRRLQQELAVAMSRMHGQLAGGLLAFAPAPDFKVVARLQSAIEGKGHRMTELYQSGRILRTPLRLEEVA